MNGKVLVLTEGSNEIGLGHIGRVNSLLSVFREDNLEIEWFIKGGQTIDLSLYEKVSFVEWDQDLFLEKVSLFTYIIIDTYLVDKEFLQKIVDLGKKTLFIIDGKLSYCDSNFNCNVFTLFASAYASKDMVSSKVNFIGGVEYLLFKDDFYKVKVKNELSDVINKVVINIGGFYDVNFINNICKVVDSEFSEIDIYILGKPKCNKVNVFYSKKNNLHYLFLKDSAYVELLNQSDLIICNGGQSINEAIFLNKPTIVIEMAENQRKNIDYWNNLKVISYIGNKDDKFLLDKLCNELKLLKSRRVRDLLKSVNKVEFSSNVKKNILNQIIK